MDYALKGHFKVEEKTTWTKQRYHQQAHIVYYKVYCETQDAKPTEETRVTLVYQKEIYVLRGQLEDEEQRLPAKQRNPLATPYSVLQILLSDL